MNKTNIETDTASGNAPRESVTRNAYYAYISEGIADSDSNFIPMSFDAFKRMRHEHLVAIFGHYAGDGKA